MQVQRWSVYRADLDPVIGSEQGKSRPVLIISDNTINALLNTINIIPITSRKSGRRIYPNEVLILQGQFGLPNESIVLCHQIRTIDKRRLSQFYGNVDAASVQHAILEALSFQLGI